MHAEGSMTLPYTQRNCEALVTGSVHRVVLAGCTSRHSLTKPDSAVPPLTVCRSLPLEECQSLTSTSLISWSLPNPHQQSASRTAAWLPPPVKEHSSLTRRALGHAGTPPQGGYTLGEGRGSGLIRPNPSPTTTRFLTPPPPPHRRDLCVKHLMHGQAAHRLHEGLEC
ncbi:hypothetical protein E2C01_041712 [Portunus trituberculatus]|uniref:Uncharacterized protein n=1 Tax=Portunus trituberculatus TaxID=210409 RepID=A0A5B7FJY8_PORTR|nr:hypothetical protein [Portunus trituberculatus]